MEEPFLARLPMEEDLLEAVTGAFRERSVRKAGFNLIGAVRKAVLGYYDPESRDYSSKEFRGPLEVVACMGNISEKDGEIFAHAHAVLSGEDYGCIGGHVMPGTVIFAAELHGTPLPGRAAVRKFDEPTGLALWSES